MLDSLELFALGLASLIDVVLLYVLFERANRDLVTIWLKVLIASMSLMHIASFVHAIIAFSSDDPIVWANRVSMFFMALGMLLLPSGMVHASVRLSHTGYQVKPPVDVRYLMIYTPLLMLPWIGYHLIQTKEPRFLDAVDRFLQPYLGFLIVSNLASAWFFFSVRKKIAAPHATSFFLQLSAAMLLVTLIVVVLFEWFRGTRSEPIMALCAQLSPLLTLAIFAWHTVRWKLIPLVIERALVYGAFLMLLLLFHQAFILPWNDPWKEIVPIDLLWIEFGVLAVLLMSIRTLRFRVLEASRYLLSQNILRFRDATRRVSLEMTRQNSASIPRLRQWLEEILPSEIEVDSAHVWLRTDATLPRAKYHDAPHPDGCLHRDDLQSILALMNSEGRTYLDRTREASQANCELLYRLEAMSVFRLNFESIDGLLIIGHRLRGDRFSEEQIHALCLLADQLAATLQSKHQEALRLQLERKAMQQEKLTTLGLISGSIAHELRNPLSSMKTIASLLLEDSQLNSTQAKDVKIILEEVDRLHQTTQRLLQFSRPADEKQTSIYPDIVIDRMLQILGHLAKQNRVLLETQLGCPGVTLGTTDAALSEIVFNLIRNAIEAASDVDQGRVVVQSLAEKNSVMISITDNGQGISLEMQRKIFEPFVTSKLDGTGLGLYIVQERVQEIGGTIEIISTPSQGTRFLVQLPRLS